MKNKAGLIIVLAAFMVIVYGSVLQAQITVSPKISRDNVSQASNHLRRNIKTVRSLIKVGNFERAKELLQSLEETYGLLPAIKKEYKNIYGGQKDYPALKQYILEELEAAPDSFDLVCELGYAYYQTDDIELAEQTWEHALELAGEFKIRYIILAGYYQKNSFFKEAISVYHHARTVFGDPLIFSNELSDIYLLIGNYRGAVSEYINLLINNPESYKYSSQQIISITKESEQPEIVKQVINQALNDNPESSELYEILGKIAMLDNDLESAFENYKKADKLADSRGKFLLNFVNLCFNNKNYEMTVEAANYFLNNIKGNQTAPVLLFKARGLAELGSYQPAFDILKQVEKMSNNSRLQVEAILITGEIYAEKLKDFESAKKQFARIASDKRLSRYTNTAGLKLAELNIMTRDFESASKQLKELENIKKDKNLNENVQFLQAEIAFYTYDFKNAMTEYSKIIKQNPSGFYTNDCLDRKAILSETEDDTVLYLIADANHAYYAGNFKDAVSILEKAAERTDSKVYEYVLFNLGYNYSKAGLWDSAIKTYEKYLNVFPKGIYPDQALFNLAEIYYEKNNQPGKADLLLEKLVTEYPASPLLEKARQYLNRIKAA